jgi:hypothetical protein
MEFEVEKYGLVFVYAFIYMHSCVWILFGIYYSNSIYDMFKQKEHMCKTITRNNLAKNNYGLLNEFFKMAIIDMGFLIH